MMTKQARRIDSPDLSPSTPASELPFGVPAPYWLDLRSYDPVAVAAALGKPILILRGGRDYQATATGACGVRASAAHGPGGRHRHRQLADSRYRSARDVAAAAVSEFRRRG
jgi:hypothetical protein